MLRRDQKNTETPRTERSAATEAVYRRAQKIFSVPRDHTESSASVFPSDESALTSTSERNAVMSARAPSIIELNDTPHVRMRARRRAAQTRKQPTEGRAHRIRHRGQNVPTCSCCAQPTTDQAVPPTPPGRRSASTKSLRRSVRRSARMAQARCNRSRRGRCGLFR